ncbi:O-antigen ligase family protein [Novosphingobium sp.]|uniref:O-antigen ligase family protein n=1 Tax=Novosphingobium sp. TaxID=1874826 RepID=UPI003342AAF7
MDSAELIGLRPLSALVLGAGCMTLQWQQIVRLRFLFALVLVCVVLPMLQLVPLPPHIYAALPGRTLIIAIDHAVGNSAIWRPFSMSPTRTWNALWATMAPAAVLVLGAQLGAADLRRLLPVVLVLGMISAGLGIVQMVSDPHSPLYLYETTTAGMPIGLFANRNHQAVFLATLLIMLATWAGWSGQRAGRTGRSETFASDVQPTTQAMRDRAGESGIKRRKSGPRLGGTMRASIAALLGVVLLPVILGTGSRSGLAMTVVACLSLPLVYRGRRGANSPSGAKTDPNKAAQHGWSGIIARGRQIVPYMAPITGLAIVGTAVWLGRAESVNRLLEQDASQDLRFQMLPVALGMAGHFWPLGSGVGTFLPVFRTFEPDSMLSPRIMAQVNNDWIEVVTTAGLPGALLLLTAVVLWVVRARTVLRSDQSEFRFARLGLLVNLIFALASVTDYPARVPAISCLIVLAALWSVVQDDYGVFIRGSDPQGGRIA